MIRSGVKFTKDKKVVFPKNLKFAEDMKLTPREWLTWIYLTAENAPKEYENSFCGSMPSRYRTIKKLKKMGIL